MKATTRLLFAALIVTGLANLTGCANHPELRPYTAEETRELALESLARQGLPFDEFQRRKAELLHPATAAEQGIADAAAVAGQAPRVKG
ncbi:hypothetical protein SFA35_17385 [Pseudomonas sp. HR96]|uniref:hypothetical protein n=1 Tax=Pseudomonas sp. HR96 TaxID=1027966 RepID=UPI002A74F64F|nr:hypothetical protein [Pseudomonas sp. HR96]WPO98403.1 hypothetical protein SFA35_17385 [Pseudomonas sp. HR96]